MTKKEIAQAKKLLDDRAERLETIIDGDAQSLTAYWVDGGQKLFRSLEEVKNWLSH